MDTLISNATPEEITTWVAVACAFAGLLIGFIAVIFEAKNLSDDERRLQ